MQFYKGNPISWRNRIRAIISILRGKATIFAHELNCKGALVPATKESLIIVGHVNVINENSEHGKIYMELEINDNMVSLPRQ